MGQSEDHNMSDFEVALMDTISSVFEILVAKNVIPAEVIAKMLQHQRKAYPAEKMPGALFVMDILCERLTDPARTATRKLERDPPQGLA